MGKVPAASNRLSAVRFKGTPGRVERVMMHGRSPTYLHLSSRLAAAAGMLLLAGCGELQDPEPPSEEQPTLDLRTLLAAALVSDPVATAAGTVAVSSPHRAGEVDVVYVSLPPGTLPGAQHVRIRSRRTESVAETAMQEGGFDPVPIAASAGDTLDLDVRAAGSEAPLQFFVVVPERRPPIVVRTDPPPRKRDVPLNATLLIVFSEPMDPATLTPLSIRLLRGGTPVPGTIELADQAGLTVTFTPSTALDAATDHVLQVTPEIEDRDGEALASTLQVPFTTEAGPEASAIAFVVPGLGVYVANPDGSEPRQLTWDYWEHRDATPALSPNGSRLVFGRGSGSQANDQGLYAINIDGSGLARLVSDQFNPHSPSWSPDGQWVAYSACPTLTPCYTERLWVMRADGSGRYQLTSDPSWVVEDGATWSPDGSRIAFGTSRGYEDYPGVLDRHIYVVNRDGSGLRLLTQWGFRSRVSWSPDGRSIAFVRRCCWPSIRSIWVMNADGSGAVTLGEGLYPSWSPDGQSIAFERGDSIHVMNADGRGFVSLGPGRSPAWSRSSALPPTQLTIEQAPHPNGNRQADTVLATLPAPLRARVLRGRVPAAGIEVAWTTNHGSVSPATILSDSAGIASAVWTLGEQRWVGHYPDIPLTASAWIGEPRGKGSQVASFTAVARPGNAAQLMMLPHVTPLGTSEYEQAAAVNSALPWDLTLEALDAHGNGLDSAGYSALPLTWDVSGGGFVTTRVQSRGSPLWLWATFTLGPAEGIHVAEVTSPDLPGVRLTYSARAVTALITYIHESGCPANQTLPVLGRFEPLQVTVSAGRTVGWFVDPTCADHTITFEDDPTEPVSRGTFAAGQLPPFHTRTFSTPGSYRFRCLLHSTSFTDGEVGVVIAQ